MKTTWCRLLFSLLFAALLPRCFILPADIVEAPLEDLEKPSLEVRFNAGQGGSLRLMYESVKGGDCLRYTAGKARLNGVELEQREKGFGVVIITPIGGGVACTEPMWFFDLPPETEAVSEFEIADTTGRLLYGVSWLTARRSVAVREQHPPIVPGGPLTLAWSPETDQLTGVEVKMGLETLSPHEVAVRDGRIGFVVPPSVGTGAREITLYRFIHPGIAYCEPDPDGCNAIWLPDELTSDTTFVDVNVQ